MEILQRVGRLLREREITPVLDNGGLSFPAKCNSLGARIRILATEEAFAVTAHLGLFVPRERRIAMYEAISRANWRLKFVRFEMDSDDGELRVRCDMPLFGTEPSDEQITRMIQAIWFVTGQYATAILQILWGNAEVAEVIALAEGRAELRLTATSTEAVVN